MSKLLIVMLIAYTVGILTGEAVAEHRASVGCITEMRTYLGEKEYVCMKIPDEGLAKNNKELM